MPMFDFDCGSCGSRFEVLVGGANQFSAPSECPDCGSPEFERAWTFEGHVSQTEFRDAATIRADLRHKADIERAYAKGTLIDCKEKGPLELRPKFPKRLY